MRFEGSQSIVEFKGPQVRNELVASYESEKLGIE